MANKIFSFKMSAPDGTFYNKVKSIKGLRALTGIGLKEAKDLAEDIECAFPNALTTTLSVQPDADKVSEAIVSIKDGGIAIIDNSGPLRVEILDSIRVVCADAVAKSQYDIAQVLLELLEANQ